MTKPFPDYENIKMTSPLSRNRYMAYMEAEANKADTRSAAKALRDEAKTWDPIALDGVAA